MACVELPKDAYGRSIPLDTGTLYKKNGAAVFIYHYDYDPRDKAWYVETDDGSRSVSELLLDRDDSWKKLEEDLRRVVENKDAFYSTACAYINQGGATCNDCRLHSHNTRSCTDEMFKDVVSRIRKLRGED